MSLAYGGKSEHCVIASFFMLMVVQLFQLDDVDSDHTEDTPGPPKKAAKKKKASR